MHSCKINIFIICFILIMNHMVIPPITSFDKYTMGKCICQRMNCHAPHDRTAHSRRAVSRFLYCQIHIGHFTVDLLFGLGCQSIWQLNIQRILLIVRYFSQIDIITDIISHFNRAIFAFLIIPMEPWMQPHAIKHIFAIFYIFFLII